MKHALIVFAGLVAVAGSANAVHLEKNRLVECTPELCGDFDQNRSSVEVASGAVTVFPAGRVTVSITGLRDKATGQLLPHKTLEVHYGTLFNGINATHRLGTIVTDAEANYKGPINGDGGRTYKFPHGSINVGNFYVNDPAVPNTSLVTGFTIAP